MIAPFLLLSISINNPSKKNKKNEAFTTYSTLNHLSKLIHRELLALDLLDLTFSALFLQHSLGKEHNGRQSLLSGGDDLSRRQHKPVPTLVPQLHSVRVDDAAVPVGPIGTAATGWIDGGGDGAVLVLSSEDTGDGLGTPTAEVILGNIVFRQIGRVAPRTHPQLGVRVEVDVTPQCGRMGPDEIGNSPHLNLGECRCSIVRLRARVRISPSPSPLPVPVTVGISSNAAASSIGASSLPPHTIGGPCVNVTVDIEHRHDEDLHVLDEVDESTVVGVESIDELRCGVEQSSSSNPLTSVNASIKPDSDLGPGVILLGQSEDGQFPSLKRGTNGENVD